MKWDLIRRCWIINVFVFRFLLLFLWASFTLRALDPGKSITQYSVRIWNKEAGLPANSVFTIQQTQDGYLWFGTQEGLVRFDGINFQWYTTKNIPQLKDNVIRALYQDREGTLWIGTTSGGLTRCKQGEFTTYPITTYKALCKISAIGEDRWGNLWVGSFTEGLTCLSNGKFTTYTTKQGLPHDQVRFISKDADGDLWAATAEGIVKVIKPGVFQDYAPGNLLPDMKTACLYEPDTGNLWIGTGKSGLAQWKNGKLTIYGVEAGVPGPIITCLYKDSMNTPWIGTDGGGLTRMRDGIFSTLPGEDGLASGYVYSIHEDREGSLWVGTVDGGLHQLKDTKFATFTTREGLTHDYIYSIRESRDGGLWIGTKQGLNRWENGKVTAVSVLTARPGLLNRPVLSVYEDRWGYTWIGTMAGLHRYKDGKLISLTKADGLSDNIINCIHADRQGNTWIGTENGLNRYDVDNATFTVFTTSQGLSSNFIEGIFADSRGHLWIGTDAGLNCLKDGVFTVYNPAAGSESDYFRCACVYEDKQGILWFGSDAGLIRLEQKEAVLFTVNSGLIENHVYSILEDDSGYLWLGGRAGISRVNKKELEDFARGKVRQVQSILYNEKDGMKSGWCTAVGCKTRDGKLWFPTGKGVTMIDPNHIKADPPVPVPVIEKIIIDGETLKIKSPLELAPGKKRLEFYYTALSFIHPGKIRFKLKLAGYDSGWVEVGTIRSTTYTALSPGRYTFRVMACNAEGVWNSTGASFSFYLRPYFYQTGWFYFLVGLSLVLGGFSLYRFRVRQLKAREKELGAQVELRTRELKDHAEKLEIAHHQLQQSKVLIEEKNLKLEEQAKQLKELDEVKSRFFANISHEFRTPLTLIMGPLEQILSQGPGKEMESKVNLMLRNSRRLLNLINQLLELAKFESGKMQLQASPQDIVPFVKNIIMCFESLAQQKKVELVFKGQEDHLEVYFDPEKLEKIITNLLSNAFNYMLEAGTIRVLVRRVDAAAGFLAGCVEISVRDTGPGIPKDQLPYIFDRFYRGKGSYGPDRKGSGIGLALSKDLVELHRGDIRVNSSCRDDGTRGTEFIIRLPIGKEHLRPGEIVKEAHEREDGEKREAGKLGSWEDEEESQNYKLQNTNYKQTTNNKLQITNMGEQNSTAGKSPNEKLLRGGQGGGFLEKSPPGCQGQESIVLVAEDNPIERLFIKVTLEDQFKVIEAADGEEGILRAKEIIPDLIVSDIIMPGIDGYELCRTLKQDILTSHIPIILLTAKGSEESVLQGLETGADDYITKPYSKSLLLARAGNLLELRRQLQLERRNRMRFQPEKVTVSPVDDKFYKELQAVVEKNLSDPDFNVDALGRVLEMSQATLYRKIQALTGKTPTTFIRSYRIKRAAQLLAAKAGNVSEVADKVGFQDKSYFARCFKEQFHCSPSDIQSSEVSGTVGEEGKADDRISGSVGQWVSGSVGQCVGKQETAEATPNEKFLQGGPGGAVFSKSAPPGRGQEIILVVEDNDDARQYIRESLEPGYRVVEAADGSEGIARAIEIVPDLVISDIMMPEVDGYELCRVLKRDVRTSHIPVVLLTAKVSEESIIQGLETGADDYITKPFNTRILQSRIRNLIDLRGHLQNNRDREMALLPVKVSETEIDREFMKELEAVMEANYSDPEFNVDRLAGKLYMSRLTLYRKIHAIYGETPTEYIRSYRLKRGAQLLERSFGSVTEVAFEVGFSSSSYFARCFKEVFHRLPSDYQVSKAQ